VVGSKEWGDLAQDVVARGALVVRPAPDRADDLRGDDDVVAHALERPAQNHLGAAGVGAVVHQAVDVRTVEEVDPTVEGSSNQPLRLLFVRLPAQPEPEGQPGHLDAG
jgi:hypothetical protein